MHCWVEQQKLLLKAINWMGTGERKVRKNKSDVAGNMQSYLKLFFVLLFFSSEEQNTLTL